MKKLLLTILGTVAMVFSTSAQQNVNIPDVNFKTYLLGNMLINTDNDPLEISVVEANTFTGAILCNGLSISNLTGIEEFIQIQTLNCSDNPLINTFLDVSANTALKRLTCHNSQLRSIDVSSNTALEYLILHGNDLINIDVSTNIALKNLQLGNNNNLTSLDVSNNIALTALSLASAYQLGSIDVSSNINLEYLNVYNTGLTSLDVSANVGLLSLECSLNQLTAIDISTNILLDWFTCSSNQLTSLDVSYNPILKALDASNNQLTSLDVSYNPMLGLLGVSKNQLTSLDVLANTVLATLYCDSNQLTNLDLSNNVTLRSLTATDNQLTSLNVANGFNQDILDFRITNNPNLLCVQVDDPAYSNSSTIWSMKDIQTIYKVNCNNTSCIVTVPDTNFKSYLVNNSAINTNGDTEIQCSEAASFTGKIMCPNSNISDLTGIEAFTNIVELNCSYNQLTSIDVSSNGVLESLNCSKNQLGTIDVSSNGVLEFLNCSYNGLITLDVSNNISMKKFYCQSNQLTTIDVSSNGVLEFFNCSNNRIEDLDMISNTNLRYFWSKNGLLKNLDMANGNNQNIFSFNVKGNQNLTCVKVDNALNSSNSPLWNEDSITNYSQFNCPFIPIAVPVQLRVSKDVSVYPNPTKEIFHIETEGTEVSKIEVLDFSGRVLKEEVNVKNGIDISSLKAGIYSIKIYARGSFITKQLMKE